MSQMYGKLFASCFEGSMVGAGCHVFAVWGYCIAKADAKSHMVELNPKLLSTILGATAKQIKSAIEYLCATDDESHCQEYSGARLVHQVGHTYYLVTHEQYRAIRNTDDMRDYWADMQRKHRGKAEKNNVNDTSKTNVDSVYVSSDVSLSKGGCKGGAKPHLYANADYTEQEAFDLFWTEYPKKACKKDARRMFVRALQAAKFATLMDALLIQRKTAKWTEGFIPNPATWLNGERWDDDVAAMNVRAGAIQPQKPPPVDRSRLLVVPPRGE